MKNPLAPCCLTFATVTLLLAACASSPNDQSEAKEERLEEAQEDARESAQAMAGVKAAKTAFLASWTKQPGEMFTTDQLSKTVMTSSDFLSFDGMSQAKTVIEGWDEYASIWGPGMNGFTKASMTEIKALRTWADDDMGITASIVRIQGEMPNGQTLDVQGHLTLVFRPTDKAWSVVHEHMSMPVRE